jgi:hypothetical protein
MMKLAVLPRFADASALGDQVSDRCHFPPGLQEFLEPHLEGLQRFREACHYRLDRLARGLDATGSTLARTSVASRTIPPTRSQCQVLLWHHGQSHRHVHIGGHLGVLVDNLADMINIGGHFGGSSPSPSSALYPFGRHCEVALWAVFAAAGCLPAAGSGDLFCPFGFFCVLSSQRIIARVACLLACTACF